MTQAISTRRRTLEDHGRCCRPQTQNLGVLNNMATTEGQAPDAWERICSRGQSHEVGNATSVLETGNRRLRGVSIFSNVAQQISSKADFKWQILLSQPICDTDTVFL